MNELILDNNNSTNELNSLQSLILNSNSNNNNNNNNNSMMPHSMPSQLSPDSLGLLKQHQMQPTTSSYASLIEHQNQQLQQLQQFINNSQKISTPDVQPSVATSAQYFTDNTELNLNQLLMVNEMNSLGDSFQNDNGNYPSFNLNSIKKQQQQLHQQQQQHLMSRERGIIEKIVGSYGFVKCLDRDGRLFFHYSSFQNNDNNNTELTTSLKVGDFVEFEEGVDKRNGKPIAINLNRLDIKTSTTNSMKSSNQHDQLSSIDSSLNLMNLKELLLKNGSASGVGGGSTTSENLLLLHQQQQHQNYQAIMNGLKVLNMQNLATNNNNSEDTTANNLNSIMNLFNKENIFNNTNNNNNNLNQMNINTNILNMAKAAATTSSTTTTSSVPSSLSNGNDNLANLVKMFNVNTNLNNNNNTNLDMKQQQKNDEQMEGTVAIVATKRPSPSVSSSSILLAQQLDGRITYQRSGETFYIPYSLSDVVNTNVQLRIGDRVKFYIAHLLNNNSSNNNLLQQQQHLPVVTTYYARKVEVISHDYNLSINELAQHLLLAQQQQQQFQQQQAKQVYRGIITTLKDSFGKIEREDQFKETFFHFSEYRGPNANQELRLGLNVEFELQDRHGKEIACNIRMLTQQGTLTFDELSTQVYIGRIIQPLTKITNATNLNGINLVSLSGTNFSSIGRLIYDSNTSNNNNNNSNMNNNGESLVELSFTDRDRCDGAGEYTWLEGDFVQFRIASDKRRKTCKPQQLQLGLYQRATQMTLIEEHSLVENSINTNEHRERGVLVKLYNSKDLLPAAVAAALMENDINVNNNINKYGAIQCLEQNDLVYFSLSEVISYVRFSTTSKTTTNYSVNEVKLQVGDSLEFSVAKCQKDFIFKNGLKAIRLRQLAKNSVQFEVVSTETYNGLIEREAINSSNTTDNSSLTGLIRLDYKNGTSSNKNNNSQTINFNYTNEQSFNIGDKVKFNICTCLKTKKQTAVDLKLVEAFKEQGIITAIVSKDSIGSIELLSLNKNNNNNKQQKIIQREILFKANSLASVTFSDLNIGDHVEFNVNKKNLQNIFAENLTKIATKKSSFKIFSVNFFLPVNFLK
jgi:cold shock CspA family protein